MCLGLQIFFFLVNEGKHEMFIVINIQGREKKIKNRLKPFFVIFIFLPELVTGNSK